MKCISCEKEIPQNSRFCLNCGAPQPKIQTISPTAKTPAADGQLENSPLPSPETEEFSWLAREAALDPGLDYEAQRRFEGLPERGLGCIVTIFFGIMGLIALVPTVPLLAIFGVPAALILAPLTYFNVRGLQQRFKSNRFLKHLLGFSSSKPAVLALSVFLHLTALSAFCYLLLAVTLHNRP